VSCRPPGGRAAGSGRTRRVCTCTRGALQGARGAPCRPPATRRACSRPRPRPARTPAQPAAARPRPAAARPAWRPPAPGALPGSGLGLGPRTAPRRAPASGARAGRLCSQPPAELPPRAARCPRLHRAQTRLPCAAPSELPHSHMHWEETVHAGCNGWLRMQRPDTRRGALTMMPPHCWCPGTSGTRCLAGWHSDSECAAVSNTPVLASVIRNVQALQHPSQARQ